MPKTRNAFALRRFYEQLLEEINRYKELSGDFTPINPQKEFERFQGGNFTPPVYMALDKIVNNKPFDDLGFYHYSDLLHLGSSLKRVEFLERITTKHIEQLHIYNEKILPRILNSTVDERLKKSAIRAQTLLKRYRLFHSFISQYPAALKETTKRLRNVAFTSFNSEFGDRLKQARQRAGYSIQDAADMLGFTIVGYSQYERGMREPRMLTLRQLAETFGVTVDWLLGMKK